MKSLSVEDLGHEAFPARDRQPGWCQWNGASCEPWQTPFVPGIGNRDFLRICLQNPGASLPLESAVFPGCFQQQGKAGKQEQAGSQAESGVGKLQGANGFGQNGTAPTY